jgi:hypothetical protein
VKCKVFYLILPLFLFFQSCSTPIGRFFKAEKNIQQIKNDISTNEDKKVESAKSYLFGADYSLSLDLSPSKYSQVAKEMTSKGLVILGPPTMENANQFQDIIKKLVSTNQQEIAKGQKLLKEKDDEVVDLQNENKELSDKLEKSQIKADQVNAENAKLANTWKKITHGFWWIVWIIGIGFVLSIISKFLPPPYSTIGGIVAMPVGLLIRFLHGLVPAARDFSKSVKQETYNETKTALSNVTEAVQIIKQDSPEIYNKSVKPILLQTTSEISRPVIDKTVKDLAVTKLSQI